MSGLTDKWADYKKRFCGCKDASRLNSCKGLQNCELPANNAERQKAESVRAAYEIGSAKP